MQNLVQVTSGPPPFVTIGCLTPDQKQIELADGTKWNVVLSGQVTGRCNAVYRMNSTTYYMQGSQISVQESGGGKTPYVIYQLSGVFYMGKSNDTVVYPLDISVFPVGAPDTASFSINGQDILLSTLVVNTPPATFPVLGVAPNATLYWSVISGFKLISGVWTGTLTAGTITIDLTGITVTSPAPVPTPPPQSSPPESPTVAYQWTNLSNTIEGNGVVAMSLQSPSLFKDSSDKYQIVFAGGFQAVARIFSHFEQTRIIGGAHVGFADQARDNSEWGRALLQANLTDSTYSLSTAVDGTNLVNWAVDATGNTTGSPLNNYVGSDLSLSVWVSPLLAEVGYVSGFELGTVITVAFWPCIPVMSLGPPASLISPIVFTDTEFITDPSIFDSSLVKATAAEVFLTAVFSDHLAEYAKNQTSGRIVKGSVYPLGIIDPSYTIMDWTVL